MKSDILDIDGQYLDIDCQSYFLAQYRRRHEMICVDCSTKVQHRLK